jgi:YidC/Oxa1 family membrane protein insertase
MSDNKNTILAITISIAILIVWQIFVGGPEAERQRQLRQAQQAQQQPGQEQSVTPGGQVPGTTDPTAGGGTSAPTVGGNVQAPGGPVNRTTTLTQSARIQINTPSLHGSINLTGGRIDDITLRLYRETVEADSPEVVLFSPSGTENPYYAEFGWTAGAGTETALPGSDTVWSAVNAGPLTPDNPVTINWDNGEGLTFERVYAIDSDYMVTLTQTVRNTGDGAVTLFPYALISRHGTPQIKGFFILHEGLIGFFGEDGLEEVDYSDLAEEKLQSFENTGGWIGITDKYWAAVLIPDQNTPYKARMTAFEQGPQTVYQTDYLLDGREIAPNSETSVTGRLFAGAKVTSLIDGYQNNEGVTNFELLIDWGWFYFLTKPLYYVIDWLFQLVGNFGLAILAVTVIIKTLFFPLANKSYVSMSRMKLVQPEMVKIRERYKDDKSAQQKATMELYKKEKINPMAGCLPILLQIPVFFSLYKVLFVTIEMRHAPFYGWIHDLAAPDPTSLFNLFGLIPWDPPQFLMLGVWPLVMGITMFLQMRLNPPPPDPVQAMIFTWMPLVFMFLLASFPAGLVIYWAWNNSLSILQQATIMRRQGVKIDMWNNVKAAFGIKAPSDGTS